MTRRGDRAILVEPFPRNGVVSCYTGSLVAQLDSPRLAEEETMNDLQPTLFDIRPLQKPDYEPEMTLRQRWFAFHVANLHVYTALREMALDLKRRGFRKCGIGLLWERLRWESYIRTEGREEYKLNNGYRAFYARLLMARERELKDFFNVRPQPTEGD